MQRFDPQHALQFSSAEATEWMQHSGFSLADVVNEDEAPQAKLGALGFARSAPGARSEFQFQYDEVLVVTKGRCTVHANGRSLTAGPGEVIYLPAGVSGQLRADEELEIVYVASPPYGRVNREAKAALLRDSEPGRHP